MNSREKHVRVERCRGGDGKAMTVYDVKECEREKGKGEGERANKSRRTSRHSGECGEVCSDGNHFGKGRNRTHTHTRTYGLISAENF